MVGLVPIRIVVAGGNYAGLSAVKALYSTLLAPSADTSTDIASLASLAGLERPVEITLVDRRDGFVHFIGMTRGLTEPEYGAKLWTPYAEVAWLQHPSIKIHQASVTKITNTHVHTQTTADKTKVILPFDFLVICLGEGRFAPIGTAATSKSQFVEQINKTFGEIQAARSVAVVGGGAVGIEMAADVKCDFPEKQVTLVHSRPLLLPGPFKDEFRGIVSDILRKDIGVKLSLANRVIAQSPRSPDMNEGSDDPELVSSTATGAKLTLSNGSHLSADYVIRCLGTRRKLAGLVDLADKSIFDKTGIRVKDTMQVDASGLDNIYACGDICSRDTVKLAGVAMYGGYIAGRNIARCILYGSETQLEMGQKYSSKIMLLMGKDHFAMQIADEIWDTERTRQFATPDMGLDSCVRALALNCYPEYEPLEPIIPTEI
ncbi:hypothetical protein LPJ64_005116 [Coemansia asiatica]|uniref:FAD/NAD(P)-binding domain-containing protein n=1 Tax=Coemansia asiatica TaxID=1052880 RepID=A0A9W7XH11_9FUNG|nr:hypothetical protein LPJ64_005116 [Coemansia asiatica]